MRVKIESILLEDMMKKVSGTISPRNIVPISQSVKISAKMESLNELCMQATDFDLFISCLGEAEVLEAGQIAVPAKLLQGLVRELPRGEVGLVVKNQKLKISASSGGEYTIPSQDSVKDFPTIPKKEGVSIFLRTSVFSTMIQKVSFAVGTDPSRPELGGISLQIEPIGEENKVVMTATDGVQLSRSTVIVFGDVISHPLHAILPSKGLDEYARIDAEEEETKLVIGEDFTTIENGTVSLCLRNIDLKAKYPNVEDVISQPRDKTFSISCTDLIGLLQRAIVLSDKQFHTVRFSVLDRDCMLVQAVDLDGGNSMSERIKVSCVVGEQERRIQFPFDFQFNASYLRDGIRLMDSDVIDFQFSEPESSVMISGFLRAQGIQHEFILMPVKYSGPLFDEMSGGELNPVA
jgi:DNA polymerase-3 subunit beta